MRLPLVICVSAVLLTTGAARSGGGSPVTVAIIVNKTNSAQTLSAKALKQIFSGEKTRWPDGQKIGTLGPGPDSPEHEPAVHFLFGMSEAEYRKHCIQATFTGNMDTVPREYASSQAVINLVEIVPGAIAFVRADAVNPKVKVIKIDDRSPGEDGYPLVAPK